MCRMMLFRSVPMRQLHCLRIVALQYTARSMPHAYGLFPISLCRFAGLVHGDFPPRQQFVRKWLVQAHMPSVGERTTRFLGARPAKARPFSWRASGSRRLLFPWARYLRIAVFGMHGYTQSSERHAAAPTLDPAGPGPPETPDLCDSASVGHSCYERARRSYVYGADLFLTAKSIAWLFWEPFR